MYMKKPRILLIGTIEQSDVQNWEKANVVAAYDPYSVTRQEESPVEMLSEPCLDPGYIDAVVFVVPNYDKLPVELVCRALEQGFSVLIQKLRINRYDDLDPLRMLPNKMRNRLYIGEQYRYQPGALAIKQAVKEGRIGAVEYVGWKCTLEMNQRASWMDAYQHLVLEDLAYHHMGTLTDILGPIDGIIHARSWCPSWMNDRGYCSFLLYSDNLVMNYDVRWGAPVIHNNFFGELVLEGAGGQIWTNGERAVLYKRKGGAEKLACPVPKYTGWAGIVNHFCDFLLGVTNPLTGDLFNFDSFDNVLKLLYAGVMSMETGTAVRISMVEC